MSDDDAGGERPADCDACGRLLEGDNRRFVLAIEVYAPFDGLEVDMDEPVRTSTAELRELLATLEELDPDEAQDDIHRSFRYTLCRPCQRAYLRSPLAPRWPPAVDGR